MEQKIKVEGQVRIQVTDKDGKILYDTGFEKNTITNTGLAAIAGLVGNTGAISAFSYLALGTDATAASATQTALIAEIVDTGLARASATVSRVTTNQTNDTLQLAYTWTASGSKTIQEVGVFNAVSVGIMLGRKLVGGSGIAVVNTNNFVVTYKIIFS